jgi:hypothetical protein
MYEINTSILGQTGDVGLIQLGSPPTFGDIFDGEPQHYAGSIVQVQEVLRIVSNITNPAAVDVDKTWFNDKKYIGTWQAIDEFGGFQWRQDSYGFLNSEVQDVSFTSFYTITANPDVPIAQTEQSQITNCNFYSKADVFVFPPVPTPVPGFSLVPKSPTFLGLETLSAAPLVDRPYPQFIAGIGLHLLPGVEGVAVNYKIRIINAIYTDYPAAPVPTCVFVAPTCSQSFTAFIAAANNRYTSQATCLLSHLQCVQYSYVCPSDPNVTFPYWLGINL